MFNQKLITISENTIHKFIKSSYKKYEEYRKELKSDRKKYSHLNEVGIPEDYVPYQNHGRYNYYEHEDCIPVILGLSQTDRVFKLVNILLLNLEMNGFKIYISNEQEKFSRKMIFEKDNETMTFSLRQGYSWKKLTNNNDSLLYPDKVPVPNDNFTFDLMGLMRGGYKSFKTTTKKPLENIIESIFNAFLNMPFEQKVRRGEQERKDKEYAEENSRRAFNYEILESQKQQYKLALEEATHFERRVILKDYLIELRKEIDRLSDKEKELAVKWIEIINAYYEKNNPIQRRLRYFSKLLSDENDYFDTWFKEPIEN